MKTDLLMELDQKSTTTLPEMVKFILDKFGVKVSTQVVSNLIHNMDILWKQVTKIPAAWNKPELIEQQENCVTQHGLDLRHKVVFDNKSGFNPHSSWAFGYTPSGAFLLLSFFHFK